jgi:integrase
VAGELRISRDSGSDSSVGFTSQWEPSRSIAGMLVLTGLRVGELLALRWSDIDLTAKTLRVRQTVYNGVFDTPKTKRSNRVVPLSPLAVEILERQKREAATLSFSRPAREVRSAVAICLIGSSSRQRRSWTRRESTGIGYVTLRRACSTLRALLSAPYKRCWAFLLRGHAGALHSRRGFGVS